MTILILDFISYLHWETIFGCSFWYAYMPHILVVCIHLDIKSAAVSIFLGLFLFLQFLCSSDIKFSTCHWILHDYHACKLLFSAVRLANLIMELPNPLRHHVILPVLLWRPFLVYLLPIQIPAHRIPAPRMIRVQPRSGNSKTCPLPGHHHGRECCIYCNMGWPYSQKS